VPRAEVVEEAPADDEVAPARAPASAPANAVAPLAASYVVEPLAEPGAWRTLRDDTVLLRDERGVIVAPEASD
jgi:hypothetical protein